MNHINNEYIVGMSNELDVFGYTLRYGNFTYAGSPTVPPTFTAEMLLGNDSRYSEVSKSSPSTLAGNYTFPTASGVRQVFWIADSLPTTGVSTFTRVFKVGGSTLALYPSNNTQCQSLTINGVPGKVYITLNQNNSGLTVAISAT